LNNCKNPELDTATPPLEFLRLVISMAASKTTKTGERYKIMVNDVSRAYFYAPSLNPTFVEICEEDFEPGDEQRCGELAVSMYGTRPAAMNWQKCYTDLLIANGFTAAISCACMFYHYQKDISVFVHGDDFVSAGSDTNLKWFKKVLEGKFEITSNIVGHGSEDSKNVKILNNNSSGKRF
jgi:hypothetical protein